MTKTQKKSFTRLEGLDLARFIAYLGMVVVNFKIVMGAGGANDGLLGMLTVALEGRAAATFVVLAGIGLGLAVSHSGRRQTVLVTLKRAAFLLAVGLLNTLVFDADIIHYYAFYFLFGVFCLPLSASSLVKLILTVNIAFILMILTFNYDSGWNWVTYTYADFWTPVGFIRNLFFNGWHPVIPWLSFLLFGIYLSRLKLGDTLVQVRMMAIGAAIFFVNELLSELLKYMLADNEEGWVQLVGTAPIPPMTLYMVAGMSIATFIIGLCLRSSSWLRKVGVLKLVAPAGRQTLTLYIAHILIGMATLEALGLLGSQSLAVAVLAALIFCMFATFYAYFWSKFFKRGPIESVMRKLAG